MKMKIQVLYLTGTALLIGAAVVFINSQRAYGANA